MQAAQQTEEQSVGRTASGGRLAQSHRLCGLRDRSEEQTPKASAADAARHAGIVLSTAVHVRRPAELSAETFKRIGVFGGVAIVLVSMSLALSLVEEWVIAKDLADRKRIREVLEEIKTAELTDGKLTGC